MVVWIVVAAVIAGEIGAVYAWRQRQFPRPRWLFGLWAPTIYALLLLAAWAVGWGASSLLLGWDPALVAQQRTTFTLLVVNAIALVPIVGLTLFFNWILHTDMNDVPD